MKDFTKSLETSITALLMLTIAFLVVEPAIGSAVEDQFTVSQLITAEISFLTPATDITMSPSLAGITGGTSNGETNVRVLTNNALGYSMSLTASSSAGMIGNASAGTISAYVPSSGIVPDFSFTAPANTSRFGYTVEASTTADLAAAFKDDGISCNTGAGDTVNSCWVNASTSARQIINRSSSTPASGATTTIKFRVVINSNPVPAIPQDTYVATTTLTATTN